MTYSEQLLSPKWQRKRLSILKRDNFTCQCCGDKDSTLHVHHIEYINGKMAWEYPNKKLTTVCKHCHFVIEYLRKKYKTSYENIMITKIDWSGYILAYVYENGYLELDAIFIFSLEDDGSMAYSGEIWFFAHQLESFLDKIQMRKDAKRK